jgi:hypothetical protein
MKKADSDQQIDNPNTGTPLDYSNDLYLVYFEVMDAEGFISVLVSFLGQNILKSCKRFPYGYEVDIPIQCIPDIVRLLSAENIAVYQIVRRGISAAKK